jgi:hypothetical protein
MMMFKTVTRVGVLLLAVLLAGCVAPNRNVDYSAFRASKPASILVLPPLNTSVEPAAVAAVLSQATRPLAESGYYVVPIAVMDETFKQNGLDTPEDIHEVTPAKLRDIFGADAALYMTVTQYGSKYVVVSSSVTVAIDAKLIDLRTGSTLWTGSKTVAQGSSNSSGGLIGMLVQAMVDQVVNNLSNRSYTVAGTTTQSLLGAGQPGGILYGPRSPHYELQQ